MNEDQVFFERVGHTERAHLHAASRLSAGAGMAVLAASVGRDPADVAAEMVRIRVTIDPRSGSAGRFDASYVRLVEELESRGWLGTALAAHAREGARR